MNLYRVKRALLAPYVWHMRRKEAHQEAFIKGMLELHYYRPAFYRFIGANMVNPNILFEAPLDASSVVLDVGAYTGDWAKTMKERYDPLLWLFEPDPDSIPALAARFGGDPKVHLRSYGLHGTDATLELEQKGMGSSVFAGHAPSSGTKVSVSLRDAAAVLEEIGRRPIDLLKLNIEGGEYEVLERLIATGWLPHIRCILVQFHEWIDDAHLRRWRIQRALRRTHHLEWDHPFVWEKWLLK
jgi:FkbM family methyltransferase